MAKDKHIVRASANEVWAMRERGESRTDWRRVRALTQADADRLAEEEDGPLPAGWESGVEIGLPTRKRDVHIRLDGDVLDWFRAHGPGYQTRINVVLRAFVRARERVERDEPEPRAATRGKGARASRPPAPPLDGR